MEKMFFNNKHLITNLSYSAHAMERLSLRKISKQIINLCIKHGKVFYKTGVRFYVLLNKNIKEYNLDSRLEGTCVIISDDGKVITAYKNKDISKKIKVLKKRRKKSSLV